jgi:hypothetical protein
MYRYFDHSEDSFLQNDEIYQKIVKLLDPFTSNLNSEEDKQLMLKMISNCYHKYHNSIKLKCASDPELMLSTVMSILIEQSNEIERWSSLRSTSP